MPEVVEAYVGKADSAEEGFEGSSDQVLEVDGRASVRGEDHAAPSMLALLAQDSDFCPSARRARVSEISVLSSVCPRSKLFIRVVFFLSFHLSMKYVSL